MSVCMSQSPWSTVITSTPTSPRMICAAVARDWPERAARVGGRGCPRRPGPARTPLMASNVVRMLRPSVDFSRCHMIRSDFWRRPSSSLPGSSTSSTRPADIVAAGPTSEVGMVLVPALNPCSGDVPGVPLTSRLSQPDARRCEPGSASSISSMAAKCDRLATGSPVACTAATMPACPQRHQVGHGRVQPEECRPVTSSAVGGDRDPRPGGVVARVSVRDDEGEPVRAAAQRDARRGPTRRWPRGPARR